jgi:hypothetical protein
MSGSSSADRYNASGTGSYSSGNPSGNSSSQQSVASGSSGAYTNSSRNDRTQASRYEPEPYTTSLEESSAASSSGPTLVANDPGAVINIRDDASTSASVRHTGYAGDPVYISDTAQGDDGYTWYYVEFDSGVAGWVRGDFVDE